MTPVNPTLQDTLDIRIDVANTGDRQAEETLFLFVRRKGTGLTTPNLELKGFGKIALAPKQKGTLALQLRMSDLQSPPPGRNPDSIEILVGPSADPGRLQSISVSIEPSP